MKLRKGNMWTVYDDADLFCITTNSTLNNKGELVMGAGIAKQARDKFPRLPYVLGKIISESYANFGVYGFLHSDNWMNGKKLALFQTKTDWKLDSDIELVKRSTNMLDFFLIGREHLKVHLNFPAIGRGNLSRKEVLHCIDFLPDCVTIWERY